MIATGIAGLSYAIFAFVSNRMLGSPRSVSLNTALPAEDDHAVRSPVLRLLILTGTVVLPFVLWWAFNKLTGVPDMIAKTPVGKLLVHSTRPPPRGLRQNSGMTVPFGALPDQIPHPGGLALALVPTRRSAPPFPPLHLPVLA